MPRGHLLGGGQGLVAFLSFATSARRSFFGFDRLVVLVDLIPAISNVDEVCLFIMWMDKTLTSDSSFTMSLRVRYRPGVS